MFKMAKSKLSTPDWIREGYDSKADWQRAKELASNSPKRGQIREKAQGKKPDRKKTGKIFKVKVCPKCGSSEVKVVIDGKEGFGNKERNSVAAAPSWECKSCSWSGENVKEKEMSEDEFLEHTERMENTGGKNSS